MSLRELAATWVQATCPNPKVQTDFIAQLDDALEKSVGCSFLIGRRLTRIEQPFAVYCYCGEFFTFQLDQRQAALLQMEDAALVAARSGTKHNHRPHAAPSVSISEISLPGGTAIDPRTPIRGVLNCRASQWWNMPLAIQAVCEPAGQVSTTLFFHFHSLPQGESTIAFQLPSLGDLQDHQGSSRIGIVPLFFQMCVVGEPESLAPRQQHGEFRLQPAHPPLPPPERLPLGDYFIPSPAAPLISPETLAEQPEGEPKVAGNHTRLKRSATFEQCSSNLAEGWLEAKQRPCIYRHSPVGRSTTFA